MLRKTCRSSRCTEGYANVKGLRSFSSSTAHGRSPTLLQTLVTEGSRANRSLCCGKSWSKPPWGCWGRLWITTGSRGTLTSLSFKQDPRDQQSNHSHNIFYKPNLLSSSMTCCCLWYESSGFSCARPDQSSARSKLTERPSSWQRARNGTRACERG